MRYIVSDEATNSKVEVGEARLGFEATLRAAGFVLEDPLEPDGEIHRCHIEGDKEGSKNGWYAFHGWYAVYDSWKKGNGSWEKGNGKARTFVWTAKPKEALTQEEKSIIEAEKARLEAEREEKHADARVRAQRLWEAAKEDPEHPYLKAKGLDSAYGTRVHGDMLLVPMEDVDGQLQTLLRIWPDKHRKLLDGGDKKGSFHTIGTTTNPTCLSEGIATAASVHAAIKLCTLCCGDAGNMLVVARALKEKHPEHPFLVCGDNDRHTDGNPGAQAAKEAAEILACDYVLPDFGDIPSGSDASDWNDLARLRGTDEVARQISENRKPSDAKVIAELAKLSPLDYDRVREQKAKEQGWRVSTLDEQVSKARGKATNGTEVKKGHARSLQLRESLMSTPEPWADPVDGATLLDALEAVVKCHVVLPESAITVVAIWIAHTYLLDWLEVTPYLLAKSAVRGCGKTRLLEMLKAVTLRPRVLSSLTASTLMRVVSAQEPTLIVDEIDESLGQEGKGDLYAMINSGFSRGTAFAERSEKEGEVYVVKPYMVFCCKALAGIGRLKDTVESRSLILNMERKSTTDKVEKLREKEIPTKYLDLKRKCQRWAQDNGPLFAGAPAYLPEGLGDRQEECWEVLGQIAHLAGGHWPKKLFDACQTLVFRSGIESPMSTAEMLLSDIRAKFQLKEGDPKDGHKNMMWTVQELLPFLHEQDSRPWPDFAKGKPITASHVGRLLKRFYQADGILISSKPVRKDNAVYKGFEREQFEKAFSLYLPPIPPCKGVTGLQPIVINHLSPIQGVTEEVDVTPENEDNSLNLKECSPVTPLKGGYREEGIGEEGEEDVCQAILRHYKVETIFIDDSEIAAEAVQALLGCKGLGLDTETTGLDPHTCSVRLVQIFDGENIAYVFDVAQIGLDVLKPVFSIPMAAHNAVFDAKFLLKAGIQPEMHCTQIMARLVTGEAMEKRKDQHKHSLKAVAKKFLGLEMDKTEQKSDWSQPTLSKSQIRYAALDAVLPFKLAVELKERLKQMGQLQAYQQVQPLIDIVARQELRGVPFDADTHAVLMESWTRETEALENKLQQYVGDQVNLASPPQLAKWIQAQLPEDIIAQWPKTPKGQLETKADTILEHGDDLPGLEVLVAHRKSAKHLSTYGESYRELINPVTNRLHADFHILGTKQGKFTCGDPNLLGVPREAEIRSLIKAPEGNLIVCADFGQLELRIAAELSQDSTLLQAYQVGEDLHAKTAAVIAGIAPDRVTKQQRQAAKCVNFGFLYGQGPARFKKVAKAQHNVILTLDEAVQARDAFFATYSGIKPWQQQIGYEAEQSGKIYSKLGRLRDFRQKNDYQYTQALAMAVAGSAADVLIESLIKLDKKLVGIDAHLILHVHDEILLEAAEGSAEEAKKVLVEAMTEGFLAVFPAASTVGLVEAKAAKTWRDAK